MGHALTEGRIQQLKNQTALFNEKIWEDRVIALARYKILAKLTRQVVKILIVRAQTCDVYNEEQKVYMTEIEGGWREVNGDTYKAGKEEIEIMAGDGLLVELVKGAKAVFFNFFGGKIVYDDKEFCLRLTLNPQLRPYYNKIAGQFTVLMLAEYLRLSSPFYKDLYEWLIAHQGATDYTFQINIETFCKHFNCEKSLNGHKNDVYQRILRAKKEIEALTELRFDVEPLYSRKHKGTKQNGTLEKFIFTVHTGAYYKAAQEEKKKQEQLSQQLAEKEVIAAFKHVAEDLKEKLPIQEQMVNMIDRTIKKQKIAAAQQQQQQLAEERYAEEQSAALKERYNISDETWAQIIRETGLTFSMPPTLGDEEQTAYIVPPDDLILTPEEEEQARREMEELRKKDGDYFEEEMPGKKF